MLIPHIAETAEWKLTLSPPGGYVQELVINPVDGTLLAWTSKREYFSLEKGAVNWQKIESDINIYNLQPYFYNNKGTLYAMGASKGVYYSEDNAQTFTRSTFYSPPCRVNEMIINKQNSHIYFPCEKDRIVIGWNHLNEHHNIWTGFTGVYELAVSSDKGFLCAAVYNAENGNQFIKSGNGYDWERAGEGLGEDIKYKYMIRIGKGDEVIVAKENIYRSTDRGLSFSKIREDSLIVKIELIGRESDKIMYVTKEKIGSTDYHYYIMDTDGSNHQEISMPTGYPSMIKLSHDGSLYAQTDYPALLKSGDNGRTWENAGITSGAEFYSLSEAVDGKLWACTNAGLFLSDDDGETWEISTFGIQIFTRLRESESGQFYLINQKNVFISQDFGKNWSKCELDDTLSFSDIYISEDKIILLLKSKEKYLISTDNGNSWQQKDGNYGNYFFESATGNIWLKNGYEVNYSSDNGETWNNIDLGKKVETVVYASGDPYSGFDYTYGLANYFIYQTRTGVIILAVVQNGASYNNVYIDKYQIFRSSNLGYSWEKVKDIETSEPAGFNVNSAGEIFLYNSKVIYKSVDDGLSWAADSTHLDSVSTGYVPITTYGSDRLYLHKEFEGLAYYDIDPRNDKPRKHDIEAEVYPNPAYGASINVNLQYSGDDKIEVAVFDVLGGKRKIVFIGDSSDLPDNISFTTADLPIGMYFLRIKIANEVRAKPFVVMH